MRKFLLPLLLCCTTGTAFCQSENLMEMLDDSTGGVRRKEPVTATFKATRIINSSTVENLGMGVLDFRICHRFGQIDQGLENFFGLDNAVTCLALDYGITNWLMIGLSHSTLNKENVGFVKTKLLRQKKGGMPLSLSYFGSASVQTFTTPTLDTGQTYYFSNRLCYTHQLLIARKFSDKLSLQIMPTIFHQNLVDSTSFDNDVISLGVGGRIKVSKRIAITGEYYYRFTGVDNLAGTNKTYNSLSIGADIETGGHVFQLFFSNSSGVTERAFLSQTNHSWTDGAIHFGFNISRVFTVVKPKEFRSKGPDKW